MQQVLHVLKQYGILEKDSRWNYQPNTELKKKPKTGVIKANTLILGYKHSWSEASQEQVEEYVGIIKDAFDHHFAVG